MRLFDFDIMDSYEFTVDDVQDCSKLLNINLSIEFKPLLVFEGAEFSNDKVFSGIKN